MKICGIDISITSPGVVVEELDDDLNVIDIKCYGFTTKKKDADYNVILVGGKKDFKNQYSRYLFLQEHIIDWVKDCEYAFIEDYAYNATGSMGRIFDLGEFEGSLKLKLFEIGIKLRMFAINSNKKFYSKFGLSDKIGMYEAWKKWNGVKPDLSALPEVDNGKKGATPTSDIIDAHALCEFGRKELRLRAGIDILRNEDKCTIECFNSISKEMPNGLLVHPFMEK